MALPVLSLLAILCTIAPGSSQTPVEVAAILDRDSKVHHLVLDRFSDLSQQATRLGATVVPYLLDPDLSNGPALAAKIQARHPKLVFAIGTSAAQLAKDRIRDVPVVYSMVINPSKHDVVAAN